MCGRFTLRASTKEIAEHFALPLLGDLQPRYNIAPTQAIAVVRNGVPSSELTLLRWGLVPSWSKDPSSGPLLINARSETVATKPAFRQAFRQRRCLIPADGFYEWRRVGRTKQPLHFSRHDGGLLAFAGLWECWHAADGSALESCTILTTQANTLVQPVHERMPVILDPRDYAIWLAPTRTQPTDLQQLLVPSPDDLLRVVPVSSYVNSPKHDDARCLEESEV